MAGAGIAVTPQAAPQSGARWRSWHRKRTTDGRFTFESAPAAVLAAGGALLGTMRGMVDGVLGDDADRIHAVAVLRMLGLTLDDADKTAQQALA